METEDCGMLWVESGFGGPQWALVCHCPPLPLDCVGGWAFVLGMESKETRA
jgi:hypothetical protein